LAQNASLNIVMKWGLILVLLAAQAARAQWLGADMSFVPRLEAAGAIYAQDSLTRPAPEVFRTAGFNLVRLRLWHTPAEPWHGLDSTVAFARRCRALGFDLLLDLHFSDTWADPNSQSKPTAWEALPFDVLCDSIEQYTASVLWAFAHAGVLPVMVQLGNEIDGGMLWNDGRVGGAYDTPAQWSQFCALLNAAVNGMRSVLPPEQWPRVTIHVAQGSDSAFCRWFFDHLTSGGVEFDLIAVSYYPWWHGALDKLDSSLRFLTSHYQRDVLVVETGYPWTLEWNDTTHNLVGDPQQLLPDYPATPVGQALFIEDLRELVAAIPYGRGIGVCLWEPAWVSTATFGSAWENVALFDFSGQALEVFETFPGLVPGGLTVVRNGDSLELRWHDDVNPFYRVYSGASQDGPFTTLEGTTEGHVLRISGPFGGDSSRYFVVHGCTRR
jgi:arabinogalactan endo-1,4-beta-galactosidase